MTRSPGRRAGVLLALATIAGLCLVAVPSAQAAPAGWAGFSDFGGSSRDYTARMEQQPRGFPGAAVISNSVGGTSVGVQSGASTYLSAATPPGQRYGSSTGRPYLNLRPNNANGAPPSETTYEFDRPTPAAGWTFVLGDIDADAVEISATGADGQRVSVADLGFRGSFNYCAAPVCTPNADRPTWNPATATLTGNSRAADTNGASGWFEPRVSLSSLTFTYSQRGGFPVYQTWFSALEFTLSGSVQVPTGVESDGLELILVDADGTEVGRTRTDDNGDYSFPGLATYADYQLVLVRPPGFTSDEPLTRTVDLSGGNATEDFALRRIVPSSATGRITAGTDPVPGVTVTLRDADGNELATAVTGSDGSYVFDRIPVGTGYTVTPSLPDGFVSASPPNRSFGVDNSGAAIEDLDFTLLREPTGTASGRITRADDDSAEPGVLVTIRGPGGAVYEARSDESGNWELPDLPPGDYTATVTAPDGSTVEGTASRPFTIAPDGSGGAGLDFVIDVPPPPPSYTVSGRVTDASGQPLAGITVTVQPPGGGVPFVVRTDQDGRYVVSGLPAEDGYRVLVQAPRGSTAQPPSRTVDLSADEAGLDFVVRAAQPSPTPTPSPPDEEPDQPGAEPADTGLADTGGPALPAALGSVLLVGGGLTLLRPRRQH